MTNQTPSVGRRVRYVSHGTPVREDGTQAFTGVDRCADITEVGADGVVGLHVVNPTGHFFHPLDCGGVPYDESGAPGTWHWPPLDAGVPARSGSGHDEEATA